MVIGFPCSSTYPATKLGMSSRRLTEALQCPWRERKIRTALKATLIAGSCPEKEINGIVVVDGSF